MTEEEESDCLLGSQEETDDASMEQEENDDSSVEQEEASDDAETQLVPGSSSRAPAVVTTDQMNDRINSSLLLTLKYLVRDNQLPMLASAFWTTLLRYLCSMHSNKQVLLLLTLTSIQNISISAT